MYEDGGEMRRDEAEKLEGKKEVLGLWRLFCTFFADPEPGVEMQNRRCRTTHQLDTPKGPQP